MTSKYLFIIFIFFASLSSAQFLEAYPIGQDYYQNGVVGFYEDFQKVMLEDKISACENPEEKYVINFIVYPNKDIKYVKDFDTLAINSNKCAFDNVRKVFPKLKNWKPATNENVLTSALVSLEINPSDVLNYEFKIGSNGKKYFRDKTYFEAEYPDGEKAFRKEIRSIFSSVVSSSSSLSKLNAINVTISIDVDVEGSIVDPKVLFGTPIDKSDQDDFFRRLKKMKKFIPAKKNGKSVKTNFVFPLTLSVS